MTAEHVQLLTALVTVLKMAATWPAGMMALAIVIGPWLLAVLLVGRQARMYQNNVKLVQNYESIARDLKDIVILNTQAVQKVCDKIETNQFCPAVRKGQREP